MINSHIQMPKCVLKKFANQSSGFFCFDISSGEIKRAHPKTLNTKLEYYSNHVEDYLSSYIETKVGNLIKVIERSTFSDTKELPCGYETIVRLYVYALIARSPSLQSEMKKSLLFSLLPEKKQHDFVAEGGIEMAEKANLLKEYKVAFFVNKSEDELMLTAGGLMTGNKRIYCPVSPNRAFVLEHLNQDNDQTCNTIMVYGAEDKEDIRVMNKRIIEQELLRDKQFVVSRRKESLIELLKEMNIPFRERFL